MFEKLDDTMREQDVSLEIDHDLVQINLAVPELKGTSDPRSCCVLPVDFLIEESLREVEQVHDVVVSESEGIVYVWSVGDSSELKDTLTARIEELGFRVTETGEF